MDPARLILATPQGPIERALDQPELILGREATCDVVLSGNGASRRHARLALLGNAWVLEDLGSANGTFVNGARIQAQVLRPGDVLTFGECQVTFEATAVPPPLPDNPPPLPPPLLPPPPPALQPPPPPAFHPPPVPARPVSAPAPRHRPESPRPSRTGLWVGLAAGGAGVIGLAVGVGLYLRGGKPGPPPSATAASTAPAPAPAPSLPPAPSDKAEGAAQALAARFQAGDLDGVLALSHPTVRTHLREAFAGHPERMTRASQVLASRKPVLAGESLTEYQVTDQGRTFPLVFERVGNTWVLRSL